MLILNGVNQRTKAKMSIAREYICKLNKEELNIEIAKARGWFVASFPDHNPPAFSLCNNISMKYGILRSSKTEAWNDLRQLNKERWLDNIVDAIKLFFEAEREDVGFEISNIFVHDGKDTMLYEAILFDPASGPMTNKYAFEENDLKIAICKAWLLWKKDRGR
jgi:hypothetical protein